MNTILFPESRKRKMQEREEAPFGPPTDGSLDPWNDAPQIVVPAQTPISLSVLDDKAVLEFPAQEWETREHGITLHHLVIWPENLERLAKALLAAKQRFWPTDYMSVGEEEQP